MNFKNFSTEDALIFSFFTMYLYGLEKNKVILDLLKAVVFHSDEANTDKDLKIAVKNYMISHPRINVQSNGMFLLDIDGNSIISNLTDMMQFSINNVFLPEELTEEHKKVIRQSKTSVYTNPDLYIEILGANQAVQYISLSTESPPVP